MNSKVRTFLIKKAQQGETVYYNEVMSLIGLDHHYANDRKKIGKILGEITEFEHKNKRPLLSVIVVKNDREKQPNKSFFNWAKELGYDFADASNFKEDETKRCFDYWQRNVGDNCINQPNFFTEEDLDILRAWADKPYDKNSSAHQNAGDNIKLHLWSKTWYWASEVAEQLDGFTVEGRMSWLQRAGRGQPGTFRPYTWMRILRLGDETKDIFFTVGAEIGDEDDGLVYKLDRQFDGSSELSAQQKELIWENIPEDARWNIISKTELSNYSWEKLIQETVEFIQKYIADYDRLIALAWGNVKVVDINADADHDSSEMYLVEVPPPKGLKELKPRDPNFDERPNDNFEKKNRAQKQRGDEGETLVIKLEKKYLIDAGRQDLADKVENKPDGVGYDILSFDIDGNEKYIEVKTTTGGIDTPFNFSINELERFKRDEEKYQIYRLYSFDKTKKIAPYYIVDNINQLLLEPVDFKVYWKQQD